MLALFRNACFVKTTLLVDGMAYVYRAFFAVPDMANSAGLHTNAVFGFNRMLQRMINQVAPDYIAVLFDTSKPTFRHELFPAYKAQRPPMPDELSEQIPWIKELIRALSIPCLEYPGFEADDVIATFAVAAANKNLNVLIASADKDLCQLVNDKIAILSVTMKSMDVIDHAGVIEKFGVRPEQIIDYLTLVGDTADNVPGVKKVGCKTAKCLLDEYGTIDNIYKNLDKLKPTLKKNFEDAAPKINSFRNLIKIDCNVPVKEKIEDLVFREPDNRNYNKIIDYLGFHSAKRKISNDVQLELF